MLFFKLLILHSTPRLCKRIRMDIQIEFYAPPSLLADYNSGADHFREDTPPAQNPSPQKQTKRRKISNVRKPQKRYFTAGDTTDREVFFESNSQGEIPLTTNQPRKVGVFSRTTGELRHLFPSCSEAARSMMINRSKISRGKQA